MRLEIAVAILFRFQKPVIVWPTYYGFHVELQEEPMPFWILGHMRIEFFVPIEDFKLCQLWIMLTLKILYFLH